MIFFFIFNAEMLNVLMRDLRKKFLSSRFVTVWVSIRFTFGIKQLKVRKYIEYRHFPYPIVNVRRYNRFFEKDLFLWHVLFQIRIFRFFYCIKFWFFQGSYLNISKKKIWLKVMILTTMTKVSHYGNWIKNIFMFLYLQITYKINVWLA